MDFDEKFEAAIDKVTEATYELALVYGEEQVVNFAKWLTERGGIAIGESYVQLADDFNREQRS